MACERKCFTITWRIENYNLSFKTESGAYSTPSFVIGSTTINWTLEIIPKSATKGYINFYAKTVGKVCSNIRLYFETSFFANNELSPMFIKSSHIHPNECVSSFCYVPHQKVSIKKEDTFLPPEVLTIRCRIFKSENSFSEAGRCFIRTRIRVGRTAFIGFTEKFSSLFPSERRDLTIKSAATEKQILNLNLYLAGDQCCKDRVWIEIIPTKKDYIKFCKCKIFLLDSEGTKTVCGENEILLSNAKSQEWKFPLSFTKGHLLKKNTNFLSNDTLTLKCEFEFSTGSEYSKIEDSEFGDVLVTEDPPKLPSALEDLTCLYKDGILCDMKLRTETETFNVHKNILSARSSVFKSMFTIDMREKTTDCVIIEDLDADTVRRMLMFLYSDNLGDLNWESSKNLYFAADKYNLVTLKHRCSDFLKSNLQLSNCCELLLLSDRHQDENLKKSVQEYMTLNGETIVHSEQWKNLEKSSPVLVVETLRAMYLGK